MFKRTLIAFTGISLLFLFGLSSSFTAKDKPGTPEEMLKNRAQQLFEYLQKMNYQEASKYCLKKYRKEFILDRRWKIERFSVGEVKLDTGGKSAIVQILLGVVIPMGGSGVNIPRLTRWKLESGNWFFDPNDVPSTIDEELQQARLKNEMRRKRDPKAPPPALQWEKSSIDLGNVSRKKNSVVQLPLTNLTDQEITLKRSFYQPEYCRILSENLVLKPHEKGQIEVEILTEKLNWDFALTLQFHFQPVNELLSIMIQGSAR
jgi:hypothetical protein